MLTGNYKGRTVKIMKTSPSTVVLFFDYQSVLFEVLLLLGLETAV